MTDERATTEEGPGGFDASQTSAAKFMREAREGQALSASLGMIPPTMLARLSHETAVPRSRHGMSRKRSARTGRTKGSTRTESPKKRKRR